jgi:adenosylcobinamide kinase/adenosylcobinamide-phosphate guanylyltransferase
MPEHENQENKMIFITGGARSGKSSLAESLARRLSTLAGGREGAVTYIATARAGDREMQARIEEHRRRRPAGWTTIEAPDDLAGVLESALAGGGTVLVDCLTLYLSNLMHADGCEGRYIGELVDEEIEKLVGVCRSGNGRVIVVSNEVGMGIVPENRLAREFRDAAGRANQKLAALADEVFMCISGIPMKVK